jgi:hypothetical protein
MILPFKHLSMIAKVATDTTRLDHMKPLQTVHRITQITANGAKNRESVGVRFEKFGTRMRGSGRVCLQSQAFYYLSLTNCL